MNSFQEKLNAENLPLRHSRPRTVQINLAAREGVMSRETMDRVLEWISKSGIATIDLTGEAHELIRNFRYFVEALRALPSVTRITNRCDLTNLLEPEYASIVEFLAARKVEIIAALPARVQEPTMLQRGGDCQFEGSVAALRILNRLGYGVAGGLQLHLVVSPVGLQLPRDQGKLETDWKKDLAANYGIVFNKLQSMPNVPVGRFAAVLRANKRFETYLQSLVDAFDPSRLANVICRDSINVGWGGQVYDCDFNQQLGMQWRNGHPTFLWDVDPEKIAEREVMTGEHCFACTASANGGCGSFR